MNTISFDNIKKLFDQDNYRIGYLSNKDLVQLMNTPIKIEPTCNDFTKEIIYDNKDCCGILLIKHTLDYDYSVNDELVNMLSTIDGLSFYAPVTCLSLKMAQVLCGMGQYGKNQLVYDDKFGFETHLALALINQKIVNPPINSKPRYGYLNQCIGCNDCINACPVKALHDDDNNIWVDCVKCDQFNIFGDDKNIPSMKWGWYYNLSDQTIPNSMIESMHTLKDIKSTIGIEQFPNEIIIDNETYNIQYPICRECTSQKRCSKFNGVFPYDVNRINLIKIG